MTNSAVPPPVIPYARRPNGRAGFFAVHYATYMAVLFVLNALTGCLAWFVLPKFTTIFRDFRVSLPPICWFARFYYYPPGLAVVLAIILVLPLPLALWTMRVEPATRRRGLLLALVAVLILSYLVPVAIGAVQLWSTQVRLIQGVSGGN